MKTLRRLRDWIEGVVLMTVAASAAIFVVVLPVAIFIVCVFAVVFGIRLAWDLAGSVLQ